MRTIIRLISLFIIIFIAAETVAQGDANTFFFNGVYQRNYYNPSFDTGRQLDISFGSVFFDLSSDGPSYNDIIAQNVRGEDYLSLDNVIDQLPENTSFDLGAEIQTLQFSFRFGSSTYVSAGHLWRLDGHLTFPKSLAALFAYGNAPYIGQTLDLGHSFALASFNEIYLGMSTDVGPFKVGGRVKYLSGVEDISTEKEVIQLTTDDDIYQLRFENDYLINTSRVLDYESLDSLDFDFESFSFNNFLTGNQGWAFDVGVTVPVGTKLEASLSVLDIGKINWDGLPKNYISKGSFDFEGIDIAEYLGDTTALIIEDSLYNLLKISETNNEYSTTLPLKVNIGITYKLNETWTLGALVRSKRFRNRTKTAFSLSAYGSILPVLNIGFSYTALENSYTNIGVGGVLNLGPIQTFLTTDNILALTGPKDAKIANFRFGLNLKI